MRHAFRFPQHIRDAVKKHVINAITGLYPERFQQEPQYTAALAGRLVGVAYNGRDGFVEISSTMINDRGPKPAENWSGADLAITATIEDTETRIRKAILVQAKRGAIRELNSREHDRLMGQVRDMKKLTRSPKILELHTINGQCVPRVISGTKFLLAGGKFRSMKLQDYFVARVLTTLDGDTRDSFVSGVQDSGLVQLKAKLSQRSSQII